MLDFCQNPLSVVQLGIIRKGRFEMIILLTTFAVFVIWKIYEFSYYKSEKFLHIKKQVQKYVQDCNDLNEHIENLKNTHLGIDQLDYGVSTYYDNSTWNYKRPELKKQKYAPYIYNCSRVVCDNARKQPFKYICKYFNIKPNEENLSKIENMLNSFESAEQGKFLLNNKKNLIMQSIKRDIPFLIRTIGKKRFEKNLGFKEIDLKTMYFPQYIFKYISSGGNASLQCNVIMDINNLNRFVIYLSEIIKFKQSEAGQRTLMTSALRRKILNRDNCTCQKCKNSIRNEPNLLLEIDHIIPLSKGGMTTEENLQVLCWRCNRSKGNKIITKTS